MDPPCPRDPAADATPPAESSSFFSTRALKQFGLFATGAGFMVCSVAVTRRAIVKRQLAAMPKYYHATVPATAALSKNATTTTATTTTLAQVLKNPSPTTAGVAGAGARASSTSSIDPGRKKAQEDWRSEGSMMALEALNLATLNIVAFAVLLAGGLAFAFDISSLDELRQRARRKLYGPNAGLAADTDREIEEWVAGVLQRIGGDQDQKGEGGVLRRNRTDE